MPQNDPAPSLTVRKVRKAWWDKQPTVTFHTLTAETEDKLFARYFREFDNCLKYCNDIVTSITDPETDQKYRSWISDVNNYANHGGDMW
jgi:hypothetical protein